MNSRFLVLPATQSRPVGYMFCFCFLLIYFKGFLSNQLSQNPPNRQIFTVCRTVAVNDQSEISF